MYDDTDRLVDAEAPRYERRVCETCRVTLVDGRCDCGCSDAPVCCNGHGCSDPDETCEDAPRRPGSNHADCWICPHRCREHGEQEDRP